MAFRRENPLCEDCQKSGRVSESHHVDHIVEVSDDASKAYDWDNLRSLCRKCHNARHERFGA